MKIFKTVYKNRPWLTIDDTFLLFDFVHLVKCLRNLWFTEKSGELQYDDGGVLRTAKWSHLKQLYELESQSLVALSDLNAVAVAPRPVERQRVELVLRVFSEKTAAALKTHPDMKDTEDTVIFIMKVVKFWKICNVRRKGEDRRLNEPLRSPITDVQDSRLHYLEEFGDMAREMAGKQGMRKRQLSKDTANALWHTCHGLVELCRHLLATTHQYVHFGKFTTDPLEKKFRLDFGLIRTTSLTWP